MAPFYFYRTAAAATTPTARGHPRPWCTRVPSSEWDVVVEIPRGCGRFVLGRASARSGVAATAHAAARTRAAAVQHLHLGRDDLGGVAVLAVLVLPLARAQRALDVDLGALLHILARDLGEAVEEHHVVPLGALQILAALLVLTGHAGREDDVGHRADARHETLLRILAQFADQDNIVHASCHGYHPVSCGCRIGAGASFTAAASLLRLGRGKLAQGVDVEDGLVDLEVGHALLHDHHRLGHAADAHKALHQQFGLGRTHLADVEQLARQIARLAHGGGETAPDDGDHRAEAEHPGEARHAVQPAA